MFLSDGDRMFIFASKAGAPTNPEAKLYPGFAEYEAKTTRKIPVVALKRR